MVSIKDAYSIWTCELKVQCDYCLYCTLVNQVILLWDYRIHVKIILLFDPVSNRAASQKLLVTESFEAA